MAPQPPRRTDSATFVGKSPSEALMRSVGNHSSRSLPLTPSSVEETLISNAMPPLSSYLQQSTPQSPPLRFVAASGYVASQGFQSHSRQSTPNAYSNPVISEKNIPDLSRQSKTVESKVKPPDREDDLNSSKNSEYSVDQFMSRILSLDYETSLGEKRVGSIEDKIYNEINYKEEDTLADVLKVTILDNNENYIRDLGLPRSADYDSGLVEDFNNWALSPSNKELPIAPPRITDSTKNLKNLVSQEDIIPKSRSISQGNTQNPMESQEAAYTPSVISLEGSAFASDIEISDSLSSVNFELTSSNTDSSASSVDVKPTFATLRKKREGNIENTGGFKSFTSDIEFHEMRKQVKKSSNPQIQYDFAKYCIQLGGKYSDLGVTSLEKLAKSGYKEAQFVLGQAYADDGRYDIAFRYYSRAGRGNHYEAAYEAASLCEKGAKGLKKNDREAVEYYTKAALGGHKKAMYRLAIAELYGQLGLRRNIHNGLKWLNQGESVADKDCPEPIYELSLIYEVGIHPIVMCDIEHSQYLLLEAAQLEYPPAQYKLAYCYEYGHLGFEIDIPSSINLYQISAKAGNREAQLALSGWLISGYENVLLRNEREAFYWAHLSALQDLARAEYTMGYFLESGIGVDTNVSEAIKWYSLAAQKGDEMALKRLGEIGPLISKAKRVFKEKEEELSLELSRNPLVSIQDYKLDKKSYLKEELNELQQIIHSNDIRLLKTKIQDFEGQLSQYKQELCHKLGDLALQEANFTQQLDKLQLIIQNHEIIDMNYSSFIPVSRKEIIVKEEDEYLDFIRKYGGITGGWDSVNHSTFLSLREKYGVVNLEQFFKICVDRIPGMLESDIRNHEEWYRNYARLLDNRKKKIKEWRNEKKKNAERFIKDLEMEENINNNTTPDKKKDKNREDTRKALQEWKNAKNQEKTKVEIVDDKQKRLKEIEKRKKIKTKVQEYVGRKSRIEALENELKAVSLELQKRERDIRYSIENKKFKEKDREFLEKRKDLLHKKESSLISREKRLQSIASMVNIHAQKDPKRLLRPTISQLMKVETATDESEKAKGRFETPLIPKRQIPSWRREL